MNRNTCIAILAAAMLSATTGARAQPPADQPLFVFIYRAGPAWKPGVPMSRQGLGPHAAYMAKLQAEGRTVAAGPMLDADSGMMIVRAPNAEAARAIMAADPSVTSGIFVVEMHPWEPRFGDGGLAIHH
ncbi:MAG TPA: YciI family protein [Phenylobacterium sp.]|nr:YciI family protein [Phenylobacterium sp.]